MFGILLMTLGTVLTETAESFGKFEVDKKEEGIFTMGFLNLLMVFLFLLFSLFFGQKFFISPDSLPTLLLRTVLEVLQSHVTILAITKADRSTFSFLRVITIPLLLFVDLFLGYVLSPLQFLGIFIITVTIVVASYKNVLNKNGLWFIIFTGVNAVATISLYKYDISHYNSVLGEQLVVLTVLLLYFGTLALIKKEESIRSLMKMKFLLQSAGVGAGGLLETFAYLYAPASIILAAKRAFAVTWSTLAGWKYFGEKNLIKKLIVCLFLITGVSLLL